MKVKCFLGETMNMDSLLLIKKMNKYVCNTYSDRFITFTNWNKQLFSQMNKGGKFLKKLWCSVGGRVEQGNFVLSTELITFIGHRKEFKTWRFGRLAPIALTKG